MPALVRHLGTYINGDCPQLYLQAFDHAWNALNASASEWLGVVPASGIGVEGYFLDLERTPSTRVRKSGDDLRVLTRRPATTMLRTGDPAGLACSDVLDAVQQISRRFAIDMIPRIPPLPEELRRTAFETDVANSELKALATDLILIRERDIADDDRTDVHASLAAGLYSAALGLLLEATRRAGASMPEATSGDLQRLRVELRVVSL